MPNEKNKNSLPSFIRGTVENVNKLIAKEMVSSPAIVFFTDKLCLGFYDIDGTLYQINMERIEKLEESIANMNDPETGEPISVPEYVEKNLEPVQSQVEIITQQSTVTQEKVEQLSNAITMITSKDLSSATEPNPEPTPTPPSENDENNSGESEQENPSDIPNEENGESETPTPLPPNDEESEVGENG